MLVAGRTLTTVSANRDVASSSASHAMSRVLADCDGQFCGNPGSSCRRVGMWQPGWELLSGVEVTNESRRASGHGTRNAVGCSMLVEESIGGGIDVFRWMVEACMEGCWVGWVGAGGEGVRSLATRGVLELVPRLHLG